MSYSLGEIEAHCRKAARGAGFTWGEAEEAGHAVRRLCAAGLPGAEALLAYLTARESTYVPHTACPIKRGCTMLDSTKTPTGPCHTPLLLLPFVSSLAQERGQALALTGQGFQALAGPDGGLHLLRASETEPQITIAPATAPNAHLVWRAGCSQATYSALDRFCARLYAPETDSRREAGAGAGDDGNA